MKFSNCIVCESEKILRVGKPYGHPYDSKYDEMQCENCKLLWVEPMPTEKEIQEHYEKYYEHRREAGKSETLKSQLLRLITLKKTRDGKYLSKIIKHTEKGLFLDFGCGEGDILLLAKKKGFDVLGIDWATEVQEKLKKYDIDVKITNCLSTANIKESSVDCISATHVLEHLLDHKRFFDGVKKLLKPNGVFASKVPSGSSLRAKLKSSYWHRTYPPEHFWGFNTNNYKMLLEKNNFQILYIRDSILINELTCIARAK